MTTILDQLAAQASGADAATNERVAQELETIRARFKQAAGDLDGARFASPDGKGREVEELPWYVMIGAPGFGQDHGAAQFRPALPAVHGRGQRRRRFPAWAARATATGGSPTRRCCSTRRAATRRRIATARPTRRPGTAFSALLKQFRPNRPLNGALVTVSVMDLLLWTKAERAKFATHVRMRLSEMYAALEPRFPVYVLVTKMDMLAGFTEFFGDLRRRRARAGLGHDLRAWTSTRRSSPRPTRRDFAALEERLGAEMLARLHEERDLQRRASIYRFPQQFHSIGPLVGRVPRAGLRHPGEPQARCSCAASTTPAARRKAIRSTACWWRWRAASSWSAPASPVRAAPARASS